MKTTAVEWLTNHILNSDFETDEQWQNVFNQAKEMEKQQILDAWYDGQNDFEREVEMLAFGENYYKEKFKSEENGK